MISFLLFLSFAFAQHLRPFSCSFPSEILIKKYQNISFPLTCSALYLNAVVTPELPNGLKFVDGTLFGVVTSGFEERKYTIEVVNQEEVYSIHFTLNLDEKRMLEGVVELIPENAAWYHFIGKTKNENWKNSSYDFFSDPFDWEEFRTNAIPDNQNILLTQFYRTSFQFNTDMTPIHNFVFKLSSNAGIAIHFNGKLIYKKGISMKNIDDVTNETLTEIVAHNNFEIHLPHEIIEYGENIVTIQMQHTFETIKVQEMFFLLSFTAPLGSGLLLATSYRAMTVTITKWVQYGNPLENLVNGDKSDNGKLAIGGTQNVESSLYPNNITAKWNKGAKFFNHMQMCAANNPSVLPYHFKIYGSRYYDAEEEWFFLTEVTAEPLPAPNGCIDFQFDSPVEAFTSYRMDALKNINYLDGWGYFLEIAELDAYYQRNSMCATNDGFFAVPRNHVSKKACEIGKYGYIERKCNEDGFSDPIEHCISSEVTNITYPSLIFPTGIRTLYKPIHDGFIESYVFKCNETNTGIVINSAGIIYGTTKRAFQAECVISYTPSGRPAVDLPIQLISEATFCKSDNAFPEAIPGLEVEIECSKISPVYVGKGQYQCVYENDEAKWIPIEKCKYANPTIKYEQATYNFIKAEPIAPISPTSITNFYDSITCSGVDGLSIDENGTISGTAPSDIGSYTLTIKISNKDKTSITTLTIKLYSGYSTTVDYSSNTLNVYVGVVVKITPILAPPETVIGDCSINPTLPGGLSVSCQTGIISGSLKEPYPDNQHSVVYTFKSKEAESTITIIYHVIQCPEENGYPATFPNSQATKSCADKTDTPYGSITRKCRFTDAQESPVQWDTEEKIDCRVAYPITFNSNTNNAEVSEKGITRFLVIDPAGPLYNYTFDPPLPSSVEISGDMLMFPKGISFFHDCTVTATLDHTLQAVHNFNIYPPICEGDGYPTTLGGASANKTCPLPDYGIITAQCVTDDAPYKWGKENKQCHEAYPKSVKYSLATMYYVSYKVDPITPAIEGRPDKISFSWKDKSPGGIRLDGNTGILSGTPTTDTTAQPVFTIIVHGDHDLSVDISLSVQLLMCRADGFNDTIAGEIGIGVCLSGYSGYMSALCVVHAEQDKYVAKFDQPEDHCIELPPQFAYPSITNVFKYSEKITLTPTWDTELYGFLTFSCNEMPTYLILNDQTGVISGTVPTLEKDYELVNLVITAKHNEKASDPYFLSFYISLDVMCPKENGLLQSLYGTKMIYPCGDGKVGNKLVECGRGGKWSNIISTNCSDPIIASGGNGTVSSLITIPSIAYEDITFDDMNGFQAGFAALFVLSLNNIQVVLPPPPSGKRILSDVQVKLYVSIEPPLTEQAISDKLSDLPSSSLFSKAFKKESPNSKIVLANLSAGRLIMETQPTKAGSSLDDTTIIIIGVVGGVVFVLIVLLICCGICYCQRSHASHAEKAPTKKRGTKV